MKIAVIDSGVNGDREELKKYKIHHVSTELYCRDNKDNLGHGTAIAYILCKQMPEAEIVSFKLFEEHYWTQEEEIIDILENINNYYSDIDLIHLSNGITYICQYQRLYDLCQSLCEKKQFIISAYDNEGSISYPAAFNNAIGVSWNRLIRSVKQYYYIENSPVEILGYAGKQRLPWGKKEYKYVSGSSFVAPYITSRVARYKQENRQITLEEVKQRLLKDAEQIIEFPKFNARNDQLEKLQRIKKIRKAIVFPCNKEIIALVANTDLLSFEIVGAYDYEYSQHLNKNTREFVFGEAVANLWVDRVSNIDWEADFDTVIVGHLELISSIAKIDYCKLILDHCKKHKKNLFFFDDVHLQKNKEVLEEIAVNGNEVMSHIVRNINIGEMSYGSCHKIGSPTLAIVGTSPKQGKYNLQLSLRRRFLQDGYKIGQIGTEPSAQLFGMDVVFSNGYANTYRISAEDDILYLNKAIFEIGYRDIVIMGTQSNIIPYKFGNLGFMTFHQQNSLIAFEPDACILCVNYNDDIDYIHRTIQVLRNYYLSKVIALVVFPFPKNYQWNVSDIDLEKITIENENKIKKILEDRFKIPTYINGKKEDMDLLYEECIEKFSYEL